MIYNKTAAGLKAFQQRDASLSQRSRSVLIMIDGKRDSTALLKMLQAIGAGLEEIEVLESQGLIEVVSNAGQSIAAPVSSIAPIAAQEQKATANAAVNPVGAMSEADKFRLAYQMACQLSSGLGLRGFRLNLSVEGSGNLSDLIALAPKIKEAVGAEKFAPLAKILTS